MSIYLLLSPTYRLTFRPIAYILIVYTLKNARPRFLSDSGNIHPGMLQSPQLHSSNLNMGSKKANPDNVPRKPLPNSFYHWILLTWIALLPSKLQLFVHNLKKKECQSVLMIYSYQVWPDQGTWYWWPTIPKNLKELITCIWKIGLNNDIGDVGTSLNSKITFCNFYYQEGPGDGGKVKSKKWRVRS